MLVNNKQQLKIYSSKYMNSLFVGNFKASFAGKWIEFQDFREYTPWDDAKYIDWARSSMESSMIMRRYKEEKSSDILCYIDHRESLEYQDGVKILLLEDIIKLLYHASVASWEKFWWYVDSEDIISYVTPQRSPIWLHSLCSQSWIFHSVTFDLNISSLLNPKLKRSIIFVISDSMNIEEMSFKTSGKKHDIVFVHISSYFEDTLDMSWISFLRWIWWSLWVNLGNEVKSQEYIKLRQEQKHTFSRKLRKFWIDSIFLNEQSSLEGEFSKLMKKRMNFVK